MRILDTFLTLINFKICFYRHLKMFVILSVVLSTERPNGLQGVAEAKKSLFWRRYFAALSRAKSRHCENLQSVAMQIRGNPQ